MLCQVYKSGNDSGSPINAVPSLPWGSCTPHWPLNPESSSQKSETQAPWHSHAVRWVDQLIQDCSLMFLGNDCMTSRSSYFRELVWLELRRQACTWWNSNKHIEAVMHCSNQLNGNSRFSRTSRTWARAVQQKSSRIILGSVSQHDIGRDILLPNICS